MDTLLKTEDARSLPKESVCEVRLSISAKNSCYQVYHMQQLKSDGVNAV